MVRKCIVFVLTLTICITIVLGAGDCPAASKVLNCTPKCLQDSECSSIGGKCCANLCNQRSCVMPNQLGNSGSSAFNKNSGGGSSSGVYCGNVKCSAYEKCDFDRTTKRQKCVRT